MNKALKITTLTITAVIVLIAITAFGFFWKWEKQIRDDQAIAAADSVGKEFFALYPDSYNKEFTNDTSVHLNAIPDGQTNIALTIPRNGNSNGYTLRCTNTTATKEYFVLTGKSEEMISAIQNETCLDKEDRAQMDN